MENDEPSYKFLFLGCIKKHLTKLPLRKLTLPLIIVLITSLITYLAWHRLNPPHYYQDWHGIINGLSYSPFQKDQSPLEKKFPSGLDVDRDLRILKDYVHSIRIYSSTDGSQHVPRFAKRYNLSVTAGAWLSKDYQKNEMEIQNLIKLTKQYDNIDRLIVGNEAILRGDLTVEEVVEYIKRVKKETNLPVSTAETWDVWLKHRELSQHVDFIAIHVLPSWENIPIEKAVDYVMFRYNEIKRVFPDKHVLLAELGWPSVRTYDNLNPGILNQARFIREALNTLSKHDIDYFVIEAIDQPWKINTEGIPGPHWGLFDKDRRLKFSFSGPVYANKDWKIHALIAILLASIPAFIFTFYFQRKIHPTGLLVFSFILYFSSSVLVWAVLLPKIEPLPPFAKLVWAFLMPSQLLLFSVIIIHAFETVEALWIKKWSRFFKPYNKDEIDPKSLGKVSIHLAICNEPPEMVKETLYSLSRLNYPDFEVIVVDNNTKDEAKWRPVEEYCKFLGERFKFYHLPKWPGFKAGALNFALQNTHKDAKYIAIIDSDYVVDPDWLITTIPYFNNPKVGFIQAPQDHRDWVGNAFKTMCNWEFSGFFHIGMHHRNERNAIIQHGTMTIIRRDILEDLGGWSEWCICEDSELGLKIMQKGYEAIYINHPYGKGLTPDTFDAFRKQRFRWVYGAVQIVKRYWNWLNPLELKSNGLTFAQRYHFVAGWLPWFADAFQCIFTCLGIVWSLLMLFFPQYFQFSYTILIVPTILAFIFKIANSLILYHYKVPCGIKESLYASLAGMSVTHIIGVAVIQGFLTNNKPFYRTPKCENNSSAIIKGLMMARDEFFLFVGIWLVNLNLLISYGLQNVNMVMWVTVMGVQSIPYLAAVISSLVNTLPAFTIRPIEIPVPQSLALQPERITKTIRLK